MPSRLVITVETQILLTATHTKWGWWLFLLLAHLCPSYTHFLQCHDLNSLSANDRFLCDKCVSLEHPSIKCWTWASIQVTQHRKLGLGVYTPPELKSSRWAGQELSWRCQVCWAGKDFRHHQGPGAHTAASDSRVAQMQILSLISQ